MIKRKIYRKRKATKKPTLTRQVALIKKTLTARKPELKHFDTVTSGAIPSTSGILYTPFASIQQGLEDYGKRIGDLVRANMLSVRATFESPPDTEPVQLRMIVFTYKRNPDAVVTNTNTIINLYLSSTTHATAQFVRAWRDWDNQKSFVTHYDKTFVLKSDSADNGGMLVKALNLKIPESVSQIQYVNNGSLISANELFLLFIADSSLSTVDFQTRISYTDV